MHALVFPLCAASSDPSPEPGLSVPAAYEILENPQDDSSDSDNFLKGIVDGVGRAFGLQQKWGLDRDDRALQGITTGCARFTRLR